jgi:hypothetical protein
MNDATAKTARRDSMTIGRGGRLVLGLAPGLMLLLALAGCGPTMPTLVVAPLAAAGTPGAVPVEVNAARMHANVQPARGAPCGGVRYPVDGRAAFAATMQAAAGTAAGGAVRWVRIDGERLAYSWGAGPAMLGQVMLAPTATITAHLHIATTHGRTRARLQANGTGTRSFNGFTDCGVLGEALADAYRDALRDLSRQIADRLYLAGSGVALPRSHH